MNRAFVGDHEDQASSALPELPLSPHPNYVTARGLAQLQARLSDAQLRLASVHGDDDDARLEHDYLGRHIRWLQTRLAHAIPVAARDDPGPDRVSFGASVEVLDANDHRSRYRIVGEDEADPGQGLVSWVSPLARALVGARVGDTVVWERPDGNVEVEVEDIRFS